MGKIQRFFFWLILAVFLAVCSGFLGSSILQDRKALSARGDVSAIVADTPVSVTFATVVLGGFRGLIADILWLRSTKMQEEQRLTELVQLAELITKLEPHLDEVWVFHAWNLAYNISLLADRPEDRWMWVMDGIKLLRDDGLNANPRSAVLCRELGWIFQHKLGMNSDSDSEYFRTRWAVEMDACLGPEGSVPSPVSIRANTLETEMKMSADMMREIESEFGAIDWRVPAASSLYWGWRALKLADVRERPRCMRMVYTSLSYMVRDAGIIVGDPSAEGWVFDAVPNLAAADAVFEFVKNAAVEMRLPGTQILYVQHVRDAMRRAAASGNPGKPSELFAEMREILGDGKIVFPSEADFMDGDESVEDQIGGSG